jgi:hypothetical protein
MGETEGEYAFSRSSWEEAGLRLPDEWSPYKMRSVVLMSAAGDDVKLAALGLSRVVTSRGKADAEGVDTSVSVLWSLVSSRLGIVLFLLSMIGGYPWRGGTYKGLASYPDGPVSGFARCVFMSRGNFMFSSETIISFADIFSAFVLRESKDGGAACACGLCIVGMLMEFTQRSVLTPAGELTCGSGGRSSRRPF